MNIKKNKVFLDFENEESDLNFTLVSNSNNSEDIEIQVANILDNDLTDINIEKTIIIEFKNILSTSQEVQAIASDKVSFEIKANSIPYEGKYRMYLKLTDKTTKRSLISGAMILKVTQGIGLHSIATSDLSMTVSELQNYIIDIIKANPSTGGINLETDPIYTKDKDKLATKEEIKNKQELTQVIEFGTGLTFTNAIDALASVGANPKNTNFVILKDNDANEISLNTYDGTKWVHLLKIPLGKNHFDFTSYDTTASQNADAPNKNENDLSFNKQTGELYFLDNTKTWVPMNLKSSTVDLSDYVTTQVLTTKLNDLETKINAKQDELQPEEKEILKGNKFTNLNKLALESNTSDIRAIEDDLGDLSQLPTNVKSDIVNSIKELWQTGETLEHKLENEIKQMLDIAHIVEFDSAASDPTAIVSREQARNSITGLTNSNRAIALIIDKVAGTTYIDIWDKGKWLVGGSLGTLNLTPYLTKTEAQVTYTTKTELNTAISNLPTDDTTWKSSKQDNLSNAQKLVIDANPFTNNDKTAINDNASNIAKNSNSIGTLTNLPTTEKGSLVGSIAELDQNIKNLPAGGSSPAFESRAVKTGDENTDKSTLKSGDVLSKGGNFYLYDGHNIYWIGTNVGVFEGAMFTNYKFKIIEDSHSNFEQNNIILEIADNMNGAGLYLDVKMSISMYGAGVNIIKRTDEDIALIGLNGFSGNAINTGGVLFKIDKNKPNAIDTGDIGKRFLVNDMTFPSELMNLSSNYIIQINVSLRTPDSKDYNISLGTFELAEIKQMQSGFFEPETIKKTIGGAENTFTINHTGIASPLTINGMSITILTKVHN